MFLAHHEQIQTFVAKYWLVMAPVIGSILMSRIFDGKIDGNYFNSLKKPSYTPNVYYKIGYAGF